MKLKEYLKKNRIFMKAFAERINYSIQHISSSCSGDRKAGKKFVKVVEEATDGAVTADDWIMDKKDDNQLEFSFPTKEG